MKILSLALLGPVIAELNGRSLKLSSSRAQALLAYLAMNREYPQRREALMELLWPGMPPQSAQVNLRRALYLLRQALTAEDKSLADHFFLSDRHTIQLNPEADIALDVHRFCSLLRGSPSQEQLEGAVALYRGDFLSDFYLPDSAPFEEWANAQRGACRLQMLQALDRLSDLYLAQSDWSKAEVVARQHLAFDNLQESAHRHLLAALAGNGRCVDALTHYERLCLLLRDELEIDPSAETQALAASIQSKVRQTKAPSDEAVSSTSLKPPAISHNLPLQATTFIGREQELANILSLLADPKIRLITIIGPGGMGKTRLAIATGKQLIANTARYRDGIFFVPLVALHRPEEIPIRIAQAMELALDGKNERGVISQLLEFLKYKKLLLILDNVEHLLAGVPLLADVLSVAPSVQLLATSRERLQLVEEQVFSLVGLLRPAETAVPPPDILATYPAAALFLDRARHADANYTLTVTDAPHLVRLCWLVDGLPLALELAASWMDSVPLPEIISEVEQNLDFLETELINVPKRHRSMRAIFDASWRRLNQDEQIVLAKLSVFSGGFTLAAAVEVAGANQRILGHLVRQSLVILDQGNGRYTMHELLRQYAADRLDGLPGIEINPAIALQTNHARFFCLQLRQQETQLKGGRQQEAMTQLAADLQNILKAWQWAVDHQEIFLLHEALEGLAVFYRQRKSDEEAAMVFHQAAEVLTENLRTSTENDSVALHLLAKLLTQWGCFAPPSKINEILPRIEPSLEQATAGGEDTRYTTAQLLGLKHRQSYTAGDYATALPQAKAYLAQYETINDPWGLSQAYFQLGITANKLDMVDQSSAWLQAGLDVSRKQQDKFTAAQILYNLANNAGMKGNFAEDERLTRESLALYKELGNEAGVGIVLGMLANTVLALGRWDEASAMYQESIELCQKYGLSTYAFRQSCALAVGQLYQGEYDSANQRAQEWLAVEIENKPIQTTYHGLLYVILGAVAIVQGQYDQAKETLNYGISQTENEFFPGATLRVLQTLLAISLIQLGQMASARHQLLEILYALEGKPIGQLKWVLSATSLYLARRGLAQQALTIWTATRRFSLAANSRLFADLFGKSLAVAAASLPVETIRSAEPELGEKDLWQTAVSLLQKSEQELVNQHRFVDQDQ